mmetsp:Transcript_34026/g.55464  ORF Transcript_34026/g.55464 Transcript_34026/m.55464 type:complete len:115 (-) Transcript_34026:498-842(-)
MLGVVNGSALKKANKKQRLDRASASKTTRVTAYIGFAHKQNIKWAALVPRHTMNVDKIQTEIRNIVIGTTLGKKWKSCKTRKPQFVGAPMRHRMNIARSGDVKKHRTMNMDMLS